MSVTDTPSTGRGHRLRRPDLWRDGALAGLATASVVATLLPGVLQWFPDAGGPGKQLLVVCALGLGLLAGAVATVASRGWHRDPRWVPAVLVPVVLVAMFWLASTPNRLLLLYVATLGLALWNPRPGEGQVHEPDTRG